MRNTHPQTTRRCIPAHKENKHEAGRTKKLAQAQETKEAPCYEEVHGGEEIKGGGSSMLKNSDCRLQKRLRGEAREKSTSGGVLVRYVGARRLSATKHMRFFQQPVPDHVHRFVKSHSACTHWRDPRPWSGSNLRQDTIRSFRKLRKLNPEKELKAAFSLIGTI